MCNESDDTKTKRILGENEVSSRNRYSPWLTAWLIGYFTPSQLSPKGCKRDVTIAAFSCLSWANPWWVDRSFDHSTLFSPKRLAPIDDCSLPWVNPVFWVSLFLYVIGHSEKLTSSGNFISVIGLRYLVRPIRGVKAAAASDRGSSWERNKTEKMWTAVAQNSEWI